MYANITFVLFTAAAIMAIWASFYYVGMMP
jgi:hypothetical protein